jgi:predicted TIM-barrel fold metal-dependent hydrolase
MNSELEWVDAHHHLWDLSHIQYPWLLDRGGVRFFGQPDPIRRNYLLVDYAEDVADKLTNSVHIQVGAAAHDELRETEFAQACSNSTSGRFPSAAVVAINLGQANIQRQLELQLEFDVTRGVRHIIGKSAEENPSLPKFVPDVWVNNWKLLAENDLSFDLQLTEDQYEVVLAALSRVPELKVSICHFGSPWDQSEAGFKRWKGWMKEFSCLPNTYMKLSGFSMFKWKWEEDEFIKWALAASDIFGVERCMFGSNFPVDKLYVSYDDLFASWTKVAGQLSSSDAAYLAGRTVRNFYRL